MSVRLLGVLVRELPVKSRLVTALNGGRPRWTDTEHLLADLWALLVRVNTPEDDAPAEPVDHPIRAAMAAKELASSKAALREIYFKRKRERVNRYGR